MQLEMQSVSVAHMPLCSHFTPHGSKGLAFWSCCRRVHSQVPCLYLKATYFFWVSCSLWLFHYECAPGLWFFFFFPIDFFLISTPLIIPQECEGTVQCTETVLLGYTRGKKLIYYLAFVYPFHHQWYLLFGRGVEIERKGLINQR